MISQMGLNKIKHSFDTEPKSTAFTKIQVILTWRRVHDRASTHTALLIDLTKKKTPKRSCS